MLKLIAEVDAHPRSRAELEAEFGQVWDTKELATDFILIGIKGKLLFVKGKSDGSERVLGVQEKPRLYFDFGQEGDFSLTLQL